MYVRANVTVDLVARVALNTRNTNGGQPRSNISSGKKRVYHVW